MQKKIKSLVHIFCTFLLVSFIAADCFKGGKWQTPTEFTLTVTFVNNSSESVHLYGDHETAGPGNRLEQGGSRTKEFLFDTDGAGTKIFTAYAFRNGAVISKKEYKVAFNHYGEKLTVSYPW